jgi:hypothetical protein
MLELSPSLPSLLLLRVGGLSRLNTRATRIRPDVAEERVASIFRVGKMSERRKANRLPVSQPLTFFFARGFLCNKGGSMFLRNVGAYKTHTAPHPKIWHYSIQIIVTDSKATTQFNAICIQTLFLHSKNIKYNSKYNLSRMYLSVVDFSDVIVCQKAFHTSFWQWLSQADSCV